MLTDINGSIDTFTSYRYIGNLQLQIHNVPASTTEHNRALLTEFAATAVAQEMRRGGRGSVGMGVCFETPEG